MSEKSLAAALAYLAAGFSIMPLRPGSKLPAGPWKQHQAARSTISQLEQWFAHTDNNIGLVMGAVSNNAFALDFDDLRLARFAFDIPRLAQETFVQSTPRGIHVVFRTVGDPIETTSYHGRRLPLDVKGDRGYVVGSPSVLYDGEVYRMLSRDARVATIAKESLDARIARLRVGWPIVQAVLPHYEVGLRQEIAPQLAAWLRERGSSRDQVGGFMRALGRVVEDPESADRAREAEDIFAKPDTEVSDACLGEDVLVALQGALRSMKRQERLPQLTVQAHFDDDGTARPPEGL